jgi:hypothetical protein
LTMRAKSLPDFREVAEPKRGREGFAPMAEQRKTPTLANGIE